MSNAPHYEIDVARFWDDPYPDLAQMRKHAPIAFVPQLGSTIFTRRDDIFTQEKRIDVFSSHQPAGLMNVLMGHNMMRKDGEAHMSERAAMFPSVSRRAVRDTWLKKFQAHADRIIEELAPAGRADLCKALALPLSAECLKDITGLTNMRFEDMDAGSQAMIDGIEEYARWIAPIGMSPRRVAKRWSYGGVDFEPEDRVFFMFGSANRDEACFGDGDRFDITRDTSKSIAFGAGPHYCAGAFASRAMV